MIIRKNRITFLLNDAEYAKFRKDVNKSELKMSAFLRFLIKGKMPQEKPSAEYFEILNAVRGACRNINELTVIAKATGEIESVKLEQNLRIMQEELLKTREAVELPRKEE